MADAIVKQLIIDTSQSEQNLVELESQIKDTSKAVDSANQSFANTAKAEEGATTATKSLKAQLRELQAQLAEVDPNTDKYVELSQAASELKDKIGDAAEAVGTQAGGAFERVSGSLGLVTGRIANLDFEGAAEGAKLLAKNITDIKPADIANGIKGIGSAFAQVGKALLTNPIFLIGAAIAAAIVYSEELLSLVDGISSAEQERLAAQQESAKASKEQLDSITAQENTLRLAGKSEREILNIKIAAAQQAIIDQRAVIETLKIQRQQQIEAAERNRDILKGLLNFISLPITALLAGIDLLTEKLYNVGAISEETFKKFGNLRDKFTTSVAELIFDPAEVAKEGDAAIKEAEKTLQGLENTQAGFQLSIQQMNQKAADERQKQRDDELKAEEKLLQDILKAREKAYELSQNLTKRIKEDEKKPTDKNPLALTPEEIAAYQAKFKKQLEDQRNAEEQRIALMAEGVDKEIAQSDLKYARLRDAAQGNAEQLKAIAEQNAAEVQAIQEKAARKELADAQAVQDAKLEAASQALGAIANLANVFGKGDERRAKNAFRIQKAASIAQATVDTYKGANAIFANAAINPSTILFPAQPFIQAALAVAAGLANVATISQQKFEGGGSTPAATTPSVSDTGGGGTQPAQFNPLAGLNIGQQPEQITPRAFVLASDVASASETRQKVEDLARLG